MDTAQHTVVKYPGERGNICTPRRFDRLFVQGPFLSFSSGELWKSYTWLEFSIYSSGNWIFLASGSFPEGRSWRLRVYLFFSFSFSNLFTGQNIKFFGIFLPTSDKSQPRLHVRKKIFSQNCWEFQKVCVSFLFLRFLRPREAFVGGKFVLLACVLLYTSFVFACSKVVFISFCSYDCKWWPLNLWLNILV